MTRIFNQGHTNQVRKESCRPWARHLIFLLALASLLACLAGCAQKEVFPAGSYCVLTDEYLYKLLDRESMQANPDTEEEI